jgi:hypothetical protein
MLPVLVIFAAPNQTINYQGKLSTSGNQIVANGTYEMEFNLYTVASGGVPIWTETWSGANEVTVQSGLFSVMLGTLNPVSGVDFSQPLYLGVTIESDSEMTPRKPVGTVPAAFEADKIDNIDSTQLVRNDTVNTITATAAGGLLTLNQLGAGDLLVLQQGGTPRFSVNGAGSVTFSGALQPAGLAGTSGQILRSAGAGVAPTWVNVLSLITANNGLTNTGTALQLGGVLSQNTTIDTSTFNFGVGSGNTLSGTSNFSIGNNNTNDNTQNMQFGTGQTASGGSSGVYQIGDGNIGNNGTNLAMLGGNNTSTDDVDSIIMGRDNNTDRSTNLAIFGFSNSAVRVSDGSIIIGRKTKIDGGTNFIGIGNDNDFTVAANDENIVLGHRNTLVDASINNIIVGRDTTISGAIKNAASFGNTNQLTQNDAYAIGANLNADVVNTVSIGTDNNNKVLINSGGDIHYGMAGVGGLAPGSSRGTAGQVLVTGGPGGTDSWQTLPAAAVGLTSLNGLTGATQTFAVGTTGTDFNISSVGTTHTFNIPDASVTNRGLVTTGTQTFAGNKNFQTTETTGTGYAFTGNSLTSGGLVSLTGNALGAGRLLSLSSSSATFTGQLASIESTGSGAGNTGDALRVGKTGATGTGAAINATHAGTGLVARFNDDGTYTDTTPVAIDANGRLGIGTDTPVASLDNSGSTVFRALSLGNFAAGGSIGAAASTVDVATTINVAQTTANQTLTLPAPTNTTAGRTLFVNNTGTASFMIASNHIATGTGRIFVWTGSAWSSMFSNPGSGTQTKSKGSNQSVTNSTVLVNDTDLSFTVGPNQTWAFQFVLNVSNNNSATPDWKAAILAPAGSTCSVTQSGEEPAGGVFPQALSTNCTTPLTLVNNTIVANLIPFQVYINGTVTTGATAGTVNLQFAENTAGVGTSITVLAGSYMQAFNAAGADLAEVYYSNNPIELGSVVSLDQSKTAWVRESQSAYDQQVIGVVSTKPGYVLADNTDIDASGVPVFVALSGRVPVRVSTESGPILPGDYLVSSSTPGVAMKATQAGPVIGQALSSFDGQDIGVVTAFIKDTYFDGMYNESNLDGINNGDPVNLIPQNTNTPNQTFLADGTIADRFTHLVRRAIEKLSEMFLDMIVWVRELRAQKVVTTELCLADEFGATTCLGKGDVDYILQTRSQLPVGDLAQDIITDSEESILSDNTNSDSLQTTLNFDQVVANSSVDTLADDEGEVFVDQATVNDSNSENPQQQPESHSLISDVIPSLEYVDMVGTEEIDG